MGLLNPQESLLKCHIDHRLQPVDPYSRLIYVWSVLSEDTYIFNFNPLDSRTLHGYFPKYLRDELNFKKQSK